MITYLLNTLVDSIKTSLINKLGLDPSTEVDLDDFPQLIDDIPILDSVEELTVTENGTYTGTDGVTYNPVNVNLPLGSKSVTANGTYTASDDSLQGYSSVTVDIDDTDLYRDTTDSTYESVKTLSNCGAFPMLSLTAEINAVQDLHGYDHPWAGGAGKNKLEFSLAGCKSMTQNSGATWSGNVLSHAGVNFSVEEDGIVKTNGTASSNAILRYAYITPSVSGDYIINGLPQDGGDDTFEIMLVNDTFTVLIEPNSVASGTTVTLTAGTRYGIQIIFRNGYNSNGLTFKPMIRLATETDATFAPYSNICPITGWDSIDVYRSGVNVWDEEWKNGYYNNGVFIYAADGICCKNKIPIKPNTTLYYVKNFDINTNFYYTFYDKNGDFLQVSDYDSNGRIVKSSSGAISVPNGAYFMTFNMGAGYGATYNNNISINYPSTDTSYHAYNGQAYTTALSTTCYGGSKDIKGNERFNKEIVDLGDLAWTYRTDTAKPVFQATLTRYGVTHQVLETPNAISSIYKATNSTNISIEGYDGHFSTSVDGERLYVQDSRYTDTTAFKTALTGQTVLYELATPTTATSDAIDLTLAEGVNNVWANSGDVGDARYFRKVEL